MHACVCTCARVCVCVRSVCTCIHMCSVYHHVCINNMYTYLHVCNTCMYVCMYVHVYVLYTYVLILCTGQNLFRHYSVSYSAMIHTQSSRSVENVTTTAHIHVTVIRTCNCLNKILASSYVKVDPFFDISTLLTFCENIQLCE